MRTCSVFLVAISVFIGAACGSGDGSPGGGGGGGTGGGGGGGVGGGAGGGGGAVVDCSMLEPAPAPSGSCAANAGSPGSTLTAATQTCIALAESEGDTRVCSACECGVCREETTNCYDSGDPTKDALCQALVECARENGCEGDECYCVTPWLGCLTPGGPCVAEIEAAMGDEGLSTLRAIREEGDPTHPIVRAEALVDCTMGHADPHEAIGVCRVACGAQEAECSLLDDLACQDKRCNIDEARETARADSAEQAPNPVITSIEVDGTTVWTAGSTAAPTLTVGDQITLNGTGFGNGTEIDFAKIMIGNVRVLETTLPTYDQNMDFFDPPFQITLKNYETTELLSEWPTDIVSWTDTEIVFTLPVHAHEGPIVVQVQKRGAPLESLLRPGEPHLVTDALTVRVRDEEFEHTCDVVSELGEPVASPPVDVNIVNESWDELVALGEAIFWSYDFNIGLAHDLADFGWDEVLEGTRTDPFTGGAGDPLELFGAYPTVEGEVPDVAIDDYYFDPYPSPTPIPGVLAAQRFAGNTSNSGFAGYRYAESSHPLSGVGEWIGFNCASCHGYRITWEHAPGESVTRVVPGLPNPLWSMKWIVLGQQDGTQMDEAGPHWDADWSEAPVDKAALIYAMPQGTGEHNIFLQRGLGGHYDNDYQYSVIAIPNVTHYLPIRRSLGHTESYVGFEGSYIHSQEPDGAMGAMLSEELQAFTAYMSTLDQYDDDLRNVGLYRWLDYEDRLDCEVGEDVGEGEFVQNGWQSYPTLVEHVDAGRAIFEARCASCHEDGVGAHTNERMIRLDEVGRFFTPTIFQKQVQSIRATYLRDLYWVQHRGLLTDGHVRNLRDLVHPDRCTEGTDLYDRYYTLHPPEDPGPAGPDFPEPYPSTYRRGDVFRVPRESSPDSPSNRFIERHRYFTTVPWDPDHYYWDYQKMRAEYGPYEMGTPQPIGMPAAPHPWCVCDEGEVDDLIHYLLTL